jgi:rubredoxin
MKQYKCHDCGWVHFAISLAEAEAHTAIVNEYLAEKVPRGQIATVDRYFKCSRCGAPSSDFVPAAPGDAPMLSTLCGVVVPGVEL